MNWDHLKDQIVLLWNQCYTAWTAMPDDRQYFYLMTGLFVVVSLCCMVWSLAYERLQRQFYVQQKNYEIVVKENANLHASIRGLNEIDVEERAGSLLTRDNGIDPTFLLEFLKQFQTGHRDMLQMMQATHDDAAKRIQDSVQFSNQRVQEVASAALQKFEALSGKLSSSDVAKDVVKVMESLHIETMGTMRKLSSNFESMLDTALNNNSDDDDDDDDEDQ